MRQDHDLDLHLHQALATYAEREILDIAPMAKAALLLGLDDHPVRAVLRRKGYQVTLPPADPGMAFDLIVAWHDAATSPADDYLPRVAPRGRLIVLAARPCHARERRLRAHGFLVRLRALAEPAPHEEWLPVAPCVYDALLMTRRQSLR